MSALIENAHLRREEFPLTATTAYLNHASIGPFPQRTISALDAMNRAFGEPHILERSGQLSALDGVRAAVARLCGAAPERVAFTGSLGHGISIAAAGLSAASGDEVIVPHAEYPSLALPFLAQEQRGLRVVWAPKNADGRTDLDAIAGRITTRTRAIALSHVEFADGFRNDLRALASLCRERDIVLVVDATQSLGAVPIDVDGWGVHAIAAHGYKWVHAGFGIGVLVLSEEGLERIRPTHAGSQSISGDAFVDEQTLVWKQSAGRFETGSQPFTLLAGLGASISLLEEVGTQRILPHALELLDAVKVGAEELGYTVASSWAPEERSQIIALTTGSREADERVQQALSDAGVATALRPKGVRIAPTFYNDMSDVARLLEALPRR